MTTKTPKKHKIVDPHWTAISSDLFLKMFMLVIHGRSSSLGITAHREYFIRGCGVWPAIKTITDFCQILFFEFFFINLTTNGKQNYTKHPKIPEIASWLI